MPGGSIVSYVATADRYDAMTYRTCGRSGLALPALSLGLWHNFGDIAPMTTQRSMVHTAFDLANNHFDLANNHGPPFGTAEINFEIARRRGQSLAQMALAWVLRDPRVTTTLIGASSAEQIRENVAVLGNLAFAPEELAEIDRHAVEGGVNLWARPSTDQRP
jgi:aryl-alcohol dehydrogenase-like predicted oxidoreductase